MKLICDCGNELEFEKIDSFYEGIPEALHDLTKFYVIEKRGLDMEIEIYCCKCRANIVLVNKVSKTFNPSTVVEDSIRVFGSAKEFTKEENEAYRRSLIGISKPTGLSLFKESVREKEI